MRFQVPNPSLNPTPHMFNKNLGKVIVQPPTPQNPAILDENGNAIEAEDGNAILEN